MFVAYHGWPGPIIPMPRRSSFQGDENTNNKGSRPSISNLRTSVFSRFRRSSNRESTPRGCREFTRKRSLPPSEQFARRFSEASTIAPDSRDDGVAPPPPYSLPKGCRDYERSSSVASSLSSSTSSDMSSDATPLPFLQPSTSTGNPFDTTLVLTKDKDGESYLMPLGSLHYKRGSVSSGRGKKIAGNPMCFCTEHRGSGCVPVWNCPNIVAPP